MRAALIIGHRVNLVHDHGANGAQILPRLRTRQQQVQRLGRGHQDVRRCLQHRQPLLRQGVARAHAGTNLRQEVAAFQRQRQNFFQGLVQVLLNVIGERLKRRNIDNLRRRGQPSFDGLHDQLIDRDQKGGQRFSRARRRGDQRRISLHNGRPAFDLRLGGRAESTQEPLAHHRVRPGKRGVIQALRFQRRNGEGSHSAFYRAASPGIRPDTLPHRSRCNAA